MFIATDATELIGKTPMLQLNRVFPDSPARILAKFEAANPTSIKDRGMLSIIRKAMAEGRVRVPGCISVRPAVSNARS